jgi:hypothetical protein
MGPKAWDIEVRRNGGTAKLKLMVLTHGVEANVTLPELETIALYLADQVGRWRNDNMNAEGGTLT